MRRKCLSLVLVCLLLFALTMIPGCSEEFDTKEDPTLAEIISIGKGYLRAGDGGNATDAFTAALQISPECAEAKYGLLIARNMQFLSMLNELINLISGMAYQTSAAGDLAPEAAGFSDFRLKEGITPIGDYIQEFLAQSAVEWYETCEYLYLNLLTYQDPAFEIEHFKMYLQDFIVFEFGGRLDRSDLQFFGVLNALMRTLTDILMAHDLNYDFFNMELPSLDLNFDNLDLSDPESIMALVEQLAPLVDLVESLLTFEDNPNFLELKGEEGIARMKRAGISLGQLFWRVHLLIEDTYNESGEQPEDSVRYIDADFDRRGDRRTESLYLPGIGELEAGLVNGIDSLCTLTAMAFWDTTSLDSDPVNANPFYIAFANDLLTALDVLPIVLDNEVWQALFDALGLDVELTGTGFELIISAIPMVLPIDVGPWFASPSQTGIKDLLWSVINLWDLVVEILPTILELIDTAA